MGPIPGILNFYKKGKHHGPRKNHWQENAMYPHYSTAVPSMCICLEDCCQDDERGCVCRHCPCRYGMSHDEALKIHNESWIMTYEDAMKIIEKERIP